MCEKSDMDEHLLWAVFNKPVWDAGNASDDWEVKIFLRETCEEWAESNG